MTTYTKKERAAIHKVLVATKPFLNSGKRFEWKESYICLAICDADSSNDIPWDDFLAAREVVQSRLHPYECVEEWLEKEVKVKKRSLTHKNIQQYRHRWLDALIEEFSA